MKKGGDVGKDSNISWCDHTWNPWQGCRKVSPGCLNCYMYRDKKRYGHNPEKVVRSKNATFNSPLKWKEPARVFVCSWSDFFIEDADAWRDEAWDIMRRTPHLTYMLLTKRAESIKDRLPPDWPLENVWFGVTAENQAMADRRIPILLSIPATVRFVSVEPMIGPVKFNIYHLTGRPCFVCRIEDELSEKRGTQSHPINCGWRKDNEGFPYGGIDWVIAGGESGPDARPCHPDWLRGLRDQCATAGIPFFLKQLGEWASVSEVAGEGPHYRFDDGATVRRVGKKNAGRRLDGKEYLEFPEVVR